MAWLGQVKREPIAIANTTQPVHGDLSFITDSSARDGS